jgi:DNA-binding beta-propeller fold protein YncE
MTHYWLPSITTVLIVVGGVTTTNSADPATPLTLVRTIPLPGVEGRIDHFALDAKNQRLFMAALGNNTIEVIDLAGGEFVGRISDLASPQGIGFAPDLTRLAVAGGKDGTCRVFDARSLKPLGAIDLGDDADNVRYDATKKLFWVGYGDGGLAAIDAKSLTKTADIMLDAHPESFQLETKGDRAFVNLPNKKYVAVVDLRKKQVVAKWSLVDAEANFPMALDEEHCRLFVGCRNPPRLLVVDTASGEAIQFVDVVGDTDDVFYDAKRKRIYVAGGEGAVSVIEVSETGIKPIGRIPTAPGARTAYFVPATGSLFIAVPRRGEQNAELRIFRASGQN